MPNDWDLPEGQTQYSEVDELRARLAEVTDDEGRGHGKETRFSKHLLHRLAKVTAERDEWRMESLASATDIGALLDAVEALEDAENRDVWDAAYASLHALAAKIRKERS